MKRMLCLFLALILAVGICFSAPVTITASAADSVSYVDYTWSEESKTLSNETKSVDTYTEITSTTTEMTSGWYVVKGEITVAERMTATGEVHLILADGAHLTASEGITVNEGNYLYIYGQSPDENTMGKLTATTTTYDAAIGGLKANHAGTIVINGGNINASASASGFSAGIGSAGSRGGYQITINAGVVTATSGNSSAAIGSGNNRGDGAVRGTVHSICINGGVVNATVTANGGAAIGGGYRFDGGDITITGGTVTATNNGAGAAIGGGIYGSGGNITITGGNVSATYTHSFRNGAAIGAGYSGESAGNILVTGGTVTATSKNGCGIGNNVGNGRIVILGGTVNASGDSTYGNITAGDSGSMMLVDGTTVTISGDFTLQTDFVLSEGYTLKISEGATLTIPEGVTLTLPEEYTLVSNGTVNAVGTVNCITHKYVEGVCICGLECSHVGGTPTCTAPAVCTTCGMEYFTNHNWENGVCTYGCNTIHEPHDWSGKDGICTVCGAPCSHSGGTATCKKQAICGTCGASYGEFGDHTYKNGKCTGDGCEIVCSHETITDGVCVACGGKHCGNTENDKVVWFYDEYAATLTITGSGAMADETPWLIEYTNSIGKIDIEYGVTSIGDFAFCGCDNLTSVTIPKSVTTIGRYAFANCTALTSVTIPEGVTAIGSKAFYYCIALKSVTIPESVTTIGDNAFSNCTALKDITIGKNVATLDYSAFLGCSALESITVDDNNANFSSNEDGILFNKDKSVLICCPAGKEGDCEVPSGVTTIGNNAFSNCVKLQSVTIPVSVTTIGEENFAGCENVNLIVEPGSKAHEFAKTNSIPYIFNGYNEAETAQIEKLTFTEVRNENSEVIGYSVSFCDKEISGALNIPATYNGKPVTDIGSFVFEDCTALSAVTIPKSVTTIGAMAFCRCSSLETITIPKSVTTILAYAFIDCAKLTSIIVDENNINYSNSEDGVLFDKNKENLICYPAGKTETSYTVPESVTTIGVEAFFGCTALETVTIPESVTTIGVEAFYGCTALETVTISGIETTIGDNAFSNCKKLILTVESGSYAHNYAKTNSIPYIFNGYNEAETAQIEKLIFTLNADSESYSVTGCDTPISGELKIPATYNGKPVTSIGIHAFSSCISLETVTIGNSVTSIGDYAFSACTALATVTIPDSVTTIGNYTFNACTALTTVTIPDSVTTIGNYTFNACTALTSVTIPGSETTIGNNAFNGCTKILLFVNKNNTDVQDYATDNNINYVVDGSGELEKLTFTLNEDGESYSVTGCDTSISGELKIPATYNGKPVTKIGNNAFSNCKSLTSVVIPDSVVSLGEKAFYFCDSLETVTLSSNITVIPNDAFAYCLSLKKLPITENITSIGERAFYDSGEHGSVSLSGVTLDADAFRSCGITELTLVRCKLNDASVFINNDIEKLTLSETNIPDEMFDGDSYIKTLVAENSVLGSRSFKGCSSLKSVTVSGGEINAEAFVACSLLETVTIDNIGSVGENAFNNCQALKTVEVDATKISEGAFALCDSLKNVKLGDELEVIEKNAFEECRELTEIVIPESVTTIGNDAFSGCGNMTLTVVLGSYAHQFAKTNNIPYIFNGYNKAETAQIEKLTFTLNADSESYSVTGCDTSISGALTIPSTYNGKHVTAIGNNAFWNCKSLTSVVIPDSVVSLGEKAFYVCVSLETVTLSSNITVIPNEAFAYCESLKTLPITEKITRIGKSAFYGSGKYSKVSLSGVTIGSEAFQFCGITELTLKNCELNDVSVFINNKIEKLTLSETDIPDEMFYGNSHIKTLVAENSVLGSSAFSDCRILENVTVSGGEIKSDAFWACPSLETVTIDNIGSVGEYAFYNCQALKTVEVNATEISKYAFSMCTSLENVKLSDGVEVIGNAVFENCTSLAELELPETVTKIGKWVFNGCDLLTELVIPESVAEISDGAFVGCSNLKYVFFEGTEDAQKTIGDALETNAKIHYGSSTHTFNENYTVDVEPTCTEKGSKSQHCKYCDLTQNVTIIDELGHTPVKGGTEGVHTICSVCKEPLSTTHNLTSKVTTAPTCTEEGVETFTCECGYTYTKPVAKLGHDIVIDKAIAATCTATGLTDGKKCSVCGTTTVAQQTIAKKAHTEVTITGKAATCTATGLTDGKKCSVCGTVTKAQQTIKATGHKEVVIPAVAPTYTTVGKTEGKKCSVCGTVTVAQKDVAKLTLATPTVTQKNTAKGIQVNWNKIDGAESYVVYRSVYSGGKWSKWASIKKGVTGTSYVDGTVKLGTSYKYTVRAVNGSVMSGYQNTKDGLKYNVTPTVKVALASNGIKVSWSTAANTTGYTVYKSEYNSKTKKWSNWKTMGTVKASKTSWTDKSVKSGTQYKYTIRAVNGKVLSSYNKTGAATLYLAQPTVKIANASTGVKVSWNKVTGATGYTVYKSEYNSKTKKWSNWKNKGTVKSNKTSWTDTKVASGVQYKYTVRAINGKVASTYVASNTLLYLAQPKTTVKAVSNGINVAWTQITGATGYTVYRMEYNTKTKKWSGWKKMGNAKASKTNWTDKSAKKGVQYKYTVKAVNGNSASTYKASGSVKR